VSIRDDEEEAVRQHQIERFDQQARAEVGVQGDWCSVCDSHTVQVKGTTCPCCRDKGLVAYDKEPPK
jgi:hypothetical protein